MDSPYRGREEPYSWQRKYRRSTCEELRTLKKRRSLSDLLTFGHLGDSYFISRVKFQGMFVRADLLLDEIGFAGKHIIDYGWRGFEPQILIYDPDSREVEVLDMEHLDLFLSYDKTCVGRFDEGGYHPCPTGAKVKVFTQCRECALTWIPIQECIFEPQCRGERCECHFCSREHLVYASFIGRRIKIGMTSSTRLDERGIEQGADAIVPLISCGSRMDSRNIENLISKRLGLPQRVSQREVLESMAIPFSRERILERYSTILERLSSFCEPLRSEVIFLDRYPLELLEGTPTLTSPKGVHRGDLLGFRGRFAVYLDGNSLKALSLSDAVARKIIASETQR